MKPKIFPLACLIVAVAAVLFSSAIASGCDAVFAPVAQAQVVQAPQVFAVPQAVAVPVVRQQVVRQHVAVQAVPVVQHVPVVQQFRAVHAPVAFRAAPRFSRTVTRTRARRGLFFR